MVEQHLSELAIVASFALALVVIPQAGSASFDGNVAAIDHDAPVSTPRTGCTEHPPTTLGCRDEDEYCVTIDLATGAIRVEKDVDDHCRDDLNALK